jgi:histidine triad (HIT) family protein
MHVISRFEGQPFYNEEQKDNAKEKAEFLETKAN